MSKRKIFLVMLFFVTQASYASVNYCTTRNWNKAKTHVDKHQVTLNKNIDNYNELLKDKKSMQFMSRLYPSVVFVKMWITQTEILEVKVKNKKDIIKLALDKISTNRNKTKGLVKEFKFSKELWSTIAESCYEDEYSSYKKARDNMRKAISLSKSTDDLMTRLNLLEKEYKSEILFFYRTQKAANDYKKAVSTANKLKPMILEITSKRKLTSEDLHPFTASGLRLVRNEIFARHGFKFSSPDLIAYFNKKIWYRAGDQIVKLSKIEAYNVDFIRRVERSLLQSESIDLGSDDVTNKGMTEHYLNADSALRILSADELELFSLAKLRLMRNEIFARHGYRFNSEDLNAYFSRRVWYSPHTSEVSLSPIEAQNVSLIKSLELMKK